MENRMTQPIQRAAFAIAIPVLLAAGAAWSQAQTVQATVNEQVSANKAAAASQQRISAMDDETQTMLGDYRATLRVTR